MVPIMDAVTEILARMLGQIGFIEYLNQVGVLNVELASGDDLNDEQAMTLMTCAKDPLMLFFFGLIRMRYAVIKIENGLSASPWWDAMLAHVRDLAKESPYWAELPETIKELLE